MWDSGLKYGKIADLFTKLNYNSTRGGTARPYSDLTNKTLRHRKDFIKNVLDERHPPTPFPVAFDDPDAQLCASKFLEENVALFEGDSPMPDGRFAYPADSGEIINVLAKIICTQEVMYHRNQMHAEARKVNKDDTIAVATPMMDEDTPASNRTPPPPFKAKQTAEEQLHDFEKNILPQNIQINLNAAYPLEPQPIFTETQWLFEACHNGNNWPGELNSFTFRWLHEHKAYQITHASDHVRNFIAALKKQIELRFPLNSEQETKIYNKAHRHLSTWIKTWSACGLLIQTPEGMYRHRDLEKALIIRRSEYIAIVQNGNPQGPGMLTPNKNRHQDSLKRALDPIDLSSDTLDTKRVKPEPDNDPEFQVIDDATETRPSNAVKRSFGPPPIHAPQPFAPHSRRHGHASAETTAHPPSDPFSTLYPPRSTNSPFEPLRTSSGHHVSSRNGSPAIPAKTPTPIPSSIESTVTFDANGQSLPFRYLPPLPPGNNAARHLGENRSSSRHSLPLQRTAAPETVQKPISADVSRRSSDSFATSAVPVSIDRPLLPTPSPQPQTPGASDSKPTQGKPTTPTLFLIVEKAEGSLNSENPLAEADLRNSTLAQFFDKVTSRRQNPEETIARLRLVQRWGAKTSFVVDRSTTEEQWKQFRGDIRRNFLFQSEKKPGKMRFEVYIICEIDGESSDDEEDY